MIRFWVIVFMELPTHRYKTPARISSQKWWNHVWGLKHVNPSRSQSSIFDRFPFNVPCFRVNESTDQFFNVDSRNVLNFETATRIGYNRMRWYTAFDCADAEWRSFATILYANCVAQVCEASCFDWLLYVHSQSFSQQTKIPGSTRKYFYRVCVRFRYDTDNDARYRASTDYSGVSLMPFNGKAYILAWNCEANWQRTNAGTERSIQ